MPTCIICHLGIIKGENSSQVCPNGHLTHTDCLKEWLLHSSHCPLCREPYPKQVINKFKEFINQKEMEKQFSLEKELRRKKIKKIKEFASKMTFLKFIESIEVLINEGEFEYALSRLDLHNNDSNSIEEEHNILFLKGKVNYMRGRYDLAINQLFKLVKEKYDYPDGFLYLGKAYEALGLYDKARWAYERVK
ncbi:MAG: RING finger domain-containing protein [Promethearchaeota archaeon]